MSAGTCTCNLRQPYSRITSLKLRTHINLPYLADWALESRCPLKKALKDFARQAGKLPADVLNGFARSLDPTNRGAPQVPGASGQDIRPRALEFNWETSTAQEMLQLAPLPPALQQLWVVLRPRSNYFVPRPLTTFGGGYTPGI